MLSCQGSVAAQCRHSERTGRSRSTGRGAAHPCSRRRRGVRSITWLRKLPQSQPAAVTASSETSGSTLGHMRVVTEVRHRGLGGLDQEGDIAHQRLEAVTPR